MNHLFSPDIFLDFHTHSIRRKDAKNVVEIVSLHFGKEQEHDLFTIGKHPWWTGSLLNSDEKKKLTQLLLSEKCLAMGEMGLDKLKGESMDIQIEIFKDLLEVAVEIKKPVIIHCVRAFDNLIKLKCQYPQIQKWCVHGFSRHAELAKQLIHEGFYLSLMPVLEITKKYKDLIQSLPAEKFFLETDSMPNTQIENIYLHVAKIRGISVGELQEQLAKNANKFFNTHHCEQSEVISK